MNEKYILDMTEGAITRKLIKFAVPLLIGNLFQQVYNIVDSIVVGRHLGKEALGGVGSVGMISFLFFSLCFGLANGIGVIAAKLFGAKKEETLKSAIANSLYVILVSGIIMSLLGFFFAGPVLKIMNTPAENFDYAFTYMRITCGLTIVMAFYNGISAILRALGDSKTPLYFLIVSSVLNVVLDVLFVMELGMGVAGAAYATVVSQFVAAMGSLAFAITKNPYFKLDKSYFKINPAIIKEDVRIGVPMAFQTALISISCAILQALINGYGSNVMAAYTATGKIENIVFQPFASLGTAISTFSGQNLGAKNYDRIKKAVYRAEIMTFILSMLILLAVLLFRADIIGIFVEDKEVISLGSKGLVIASSMYFALGSIYIFRGSLSGMGDVFYSMLNGCMEVGGRVIFALILMNIPGIGFWGVWYTNIFTWILIATVAFLRFVIYLRKQSEGNAILKQENN